MITADTVIDLCKKEVGYEAPANKKNKYAEFIDKNYPNFYNGKKNGYDWCDVFVDCMFIQAYGYEKALELLCQPEHSTGAGCGYSMGFYERKGQLSTYPMKGAQIFFKNGSTIYHTGIVVAYDDKSVTVVEGNNDNGVRMVKYARHYNKIGGYGHPKFDHPTLNPDQPVPIKATSVVAREVMAGLWGDGLERKNKLTQAGYDYNRIQETVNDIFKRFDKVAGFVIAGNYGNGNRRKINLQNAGYSPEEIKNIQALVNFKLKQT